MISNKYTASPIITNFITRELSLAAATEVITTQNTSRSHARVFKNTMVIFYCVHLPHYITT